jgi:hypothetical protein
MSIKTETRAAAFFQLIEPMLYEICISGKILLKHREKLNFPCSCKDTKLILLLLKEVIGDINFIKKTCGPRLRPEKYGSPQGTCFDGPAICDGRERHVRRAGHPPRFPLFFKPFHGTCRNGFNEQVHPSPNEKKTQSPRQCELLHHYYHYIIFI